jgi:hypothetical protein
MAVPYTFGTATSSIPLSQLDSNFNTVITLGNTAIQLGNTVTTLNNMTLANVTISSGNVTLTNVTVTTANVTTANITTAVIGTATITTSTTTTANVTTANITTDNITNGTVITSLTLSYGTANGVAYLNGSKVLTTGSAMTFDGTNFQTGRIRFSDNTLSGFGGVEITSLSGVGMGLASLNYVFYNAAANSEYMRLTSTGLGIGTSSPVGRLTIQGAAGTNGINQGIGLLYSNGTQYGAFGLNNSSGWPQLMARAGAGLTFHVNSDLLTTGEAMRIDSSGNVLVTSAAGLGYGTGSGGTVTQATSKATGVTLNKPTGQITMNNAALAAGATVSFTFSNSLVSATDMLLMTVSNGTSYSVENYAVSAGVAQVRITNITGGSLSEAAILNFALIKGATS